MQEVTSYTAGWCEHVALLLIGLVCVCVCVLFLDSAGRVVLLNPHWQPDDIAEGFTVIKGPDAVETVVTAKAHTSIC